VVNVNTDELAWSFCPGGDMTRLGASTDFGALAGRVGQLPEGGRPDDRGCRQVAQGRPTANYARVWEANFKKFWGYPLSRPPIWHIGLCEGDF
jgi:hypothetical protein